MENKKITAMKKFVEKLRSEQDERYNKFELLDYLFDEHIDIMISVTNRTDGKTYAHIKTLLRLNYKYGFTFVLMCRHYTLRKAYLSTVYEIMNEEQTHGREEYTFINREDFFEVVTGKGKTICAITDLNSASDLKYRAIEMRNYDLIMYDEFIALEHEYLPYEIAALKVIYETMDRDSKKRILKNPKLLFLGNAINFASPIISYYDLFNDIEKQEMNSINIIKRLTADNEILKIAIEIRKNEAVNKTKNSKLFNLGGNNYATSGEFSTNKYLLYLSNLDNMEYFVVRYDDKYIKCYYNNLRIVLSVLEYHEMYDYCNKINYMMEGVRFLNENYYDSEHEIKMYDRSILYANTFSLNYIADNVNLREILWEEMVDERLYKEEYKEEMKIRRDDIYRQLQTLARFYEG